VRITGAKAPVVDRLLAVLIAYDEGPHHGTAIAEALFGVTTPSARLLRALPRPAGKSRRRF
jgi:beta-glucosidase